MLRSPTYPSLRTTSALLSWAINRTAGRALPGTLLFLQARTATEATLVLEEHEALLSKTLGLPTVKEKHFPNFPGVVKSLGAWGGDFVMAISEKPAQAVQQYFKVKGFETVFGYREFV